MDCKISRLDFVERPGGYSLKAKWVVIQKREIKMPEWWSKWFTTGTSKKEAKNMTKFTGEQTELKRGFKKAVISDD